MRGMKGVAQKGMEFAMELGLREIIVFSQPQTQWSIVEFRIVSKFLLA